MDVNGCSCYDLAIDEPGLTVKIPQWAPNIIDIN